MVSSTKGATGHLLGAAGSLEAAFTVMSVFTDMIPPTLNLDQPGEEMSLDYVPLIARDVSKRPRRCGQGRGIRVAMTNSFGFGGTNASLLFKKV